MPKNENSISTSNSHGESRMFGFPLDVWEAIFRWATIAALVFGGLGVGAAFVSAWVGYELTGATQKAATERISANEVQTRRAIADSDIAREGAARANERAAA